MRTSKSFRSLVVVAALGLVAIVALPARRGQEAPGGVERSGVTPAQAGTAKRGADPDELAEQRAHAARLAWGLDPFDHAPVVTAEPEGEGEAAEPARSPLPRLSGISARGDDRRAVVDRLIVAEGDRLPSGYTVVEITRHAVTLSRDREQLILTLGEER